MPRAEITMEHAESIGVFIKTKEGTVMNQDALEYIAEIAAASKETDALDEVIEYLEDNEDEAMLAEMRKVEAVIVDWPNMPDQGGFRPTGIRTIDEGEKAYFHQTKYEEGFNA